MLRRRNNSSPPDPSLPLRVSPAGSRFAHARISAQVRLLAEDFVFEIPPSRSDAATTAHRQTRADDTDIITYSNIVRVFCQAFLIEGNQDLDWDVFILSRSNSDAAEGLVLEDARLSKYLPTTAAQASTNSRSSS